MLSNTFQARTYSGFRPSGWLKDTMTLKRIDRLGTCGNISFIHFTISKMDYICKGPSDTSHTKYSLGQQESS